MVTMGKDVHFEWYTNLLQGSGQLKRIFQRNQFIVRGVPYKVGGVWELT